MMQVSTAIALFGAAALLFGTEQARADVVSPCASAAVQHSDCMWLGDETGALLPADPSFVSVPEPDPVAGTFLLPFTVATLPKPIALLEPAVPGSNQQIVSDVIFFDFDSQHQNFLRVTLFSDAEQPLQLPAGALTFVETGKPQDVFKFELPDRTPHLWVVSDVEAVPEPNTVLAMLAGLGVLSALASRRKR